MKSLLTDSTKSNKLSIKRVVVLILIILLCIVVISHMFFNKHIDQYIFDGMIDAVIWSMGFIGSEKLVDVIPRLSNRNQKSQTNNNQNNDLTEDIS